MAKHKQEIKTETAWRWLTIGQQHAGHEDELTEQVCDTDYPNESELPAFGYTVVESNDSSGAKYSVWVGGTEINDYLLSEDEAYEIASLYIDEGYDDVRVERQSLEDES